MSIELVKSYLLSCPQVRLLERVIRDYKRGIPIVLKRPGYSRRGMLQELASEGLLDIIDGVVYPHREAEEVVRKFWSIKEEKRRQYQLLRRKLASEKQLKEFIRNGKLIVRGPEDDHTYEYIDLATPFVARAGFTIGDFELRVDLYVRDGRIKMCKKTRNASAKCGGKEEVVSYLEIFTPPVGRGDPYRGGRRHATRSFQRADGYEDLLNKRKELKRILLSMVL